LSTPHDHAELLLARIALAEADLKQAETADLATASNADLVVLVERLRGTVADLVRLLSDNPELAARIRTARLDLDIAENTDLAIATNPELIALVERLRSTLADLVRLARIAI
jgi:hypothetical protein